MTFVSEGMRAALAAATEAAAADEVPVGASVMLGERLLSVAGNRTRRDCDPTAHAEILALRAAGALLQNERLNDCVLYVTLEPCAMCAAAAVHARVKRIVYGAEDLKAGGTDHGARIPHQPGCLHRPEVVGGIGAHVSAALLRDFFAGKRIISRADRSVCAVQTEFEARVGRRPAPEAK